MRHLPFNNGDKALRTCTR